MVIGDRVRRTDPDSGRHVFIDVDTQAKLDYVKSFEDTKFKLMVIPVAEDSVCVACESWYNQGKWEFIQESNLVNLLLLKESLSQQILKLIVRIGYVSAPVAIQELNQQIIWETILNHVAAWTKRKNI